jgi:hypothetical protein
LSILDCGSRIANLLMATNHMSDSTIINFDPRSSTSIGVTLPSAGKGKKLPDGHIKVAIRQYRSIPLFARLSQNRLAFC